MIINIHSLLIGIVFLTAFIITYVSIPSIIRVSKKKNLFDEPVERKVHKMRTPTLGGVAVFAGFTIAVLMFCNFALIRELQFLLVAIIILFFLGLKDDILIIAPLTKLTGQILAAGVLVFMGDLRITSLHGFFSINEIPYLVSVVLSVITYVIIINAINLIDGIDGLSATLGIVVAVTYGIWFFYVKMYDYVLVSAALTGALIAFLRFNLFANDLKIFLGDTGALIVGMVVAVLSVKFCERNIVKDNPYFILPAPTVAFGVLIVPLFDVMRVVFVRYFLSWPIFGADKRHIHHKLLEFGFSHKKIVFILAAINVFFIVLVFFLSNYFSIRRLLLIVLILAMFIFYIPSLISNKKKTNQNKKAQPEG